MNIIRVLRKAIVVSALVLLVVPAPLLAGESKKTIPIRIRINIDWNHRGSGNTRRIGTFMVNVTGKAKLTKKKGEHLKYEPDGIQATGKYDERIVMERPESKCYQQVIGRIEASGTVPITSSGDGAVSGRGGSIIISKNLGHLGTIAAMQYQGQVNTDSMLYPKKNSRDDNYTAFLVAGFKATVRDGLCNGPANTREGVIPVALTIFKELTPMGMHGSYSWQAEATPPPSTLYIGDFHGDKRLGPAKGKGARCRVGWTFGEVKPIVQIWWKQENITDRLKDILVGKKVKLEAVVQPPGMNLDGGRWEIERGIIRDYEVSKDHSKAEVRRVNDYSKPTIEFAWNDGGFLGTPQKVKFSGAVENKPVEATTTFKVFEPQVKTSIYPAPGAALVVGDDPCELILGGNEEGGYGMTIDSIIQMPPLFESHPCRIQFVQLVKEDVWIQKKFRPFSILHASNEDFALDTEYPYVEGTTTLVLNDTPGGALLRVYLQMFINQQFRSHLMFLPSGSREDPDCVWINLERVDWEWKGAAKRITDWDPWKSSEVFPQCIEAFKITLSRPPGKYLASTSEPPTWTSVKTDKGKPGFVTVGTNEDPNWKPPDW